VKEGFEKVKNVTFVHQFKYYVIQVYSEAKFQLHTFFKSTLDEG